MRPAKRPIKRTYLGRRRIAVWVTYWRTTNQPEPRDRGDSLRLAIFVLSVTPFAFAAASGVFGLTMRFVGIAVLIPLLPAAVMLLVGAPAMIVMWLYAAIANTVGRQPWKQRFTSRK